MKGNILQESTRNDFTPQQKSQLLTLQFKRLQKSITNQKKQKLLINLLQSGTQHRNANGQQSLSGNISSGTTTQMSSNVRSQGIFPSCVSHPCDVAKLESLHLNQDEEDQNQQNRQEFGLQRRNSADIEDTTMIMCRICFQKDLILISPCLCKGTMKYVHEDCLVIWLQTSHRKKCELCQTPFYIYKGRSTIKEFIMNIHSHFKEDKSRCVRLIIYVAYLWLLKNRLFNLIRVYYRLVKQMKALWMLKGLYNVFIIMLVLQLATEEYSRIKKIVQFLQNASIKYKVKGIKSKEELHQEY